MAPPGDSRRLGILGGTFDPVHLGHLIIATELAEALGLDKVLFVPAGRPPHKADLVVSPDRDRLAMLRLALSGNPAFAVSTIELDRPGPSYTADLLATLSQQIPDAHLIFLMGEDSLRDLPTWRDPAAIVQAAELGVAMRPDSTADLEAIYHSLPEARGRIHIVPTTLIGISSSQLRFRARTGRSVRYQVPELVESYMQVNGLYQDVP
ncbi:MAG: nicotinate (nicotinamide) nucleotide adenylyltransferase [Chloroflexia bacterium]|nr:nicotinate (nicotinamide) nucleotide adenylyltransferase [Chloroflexia bacterium]